MKTSIKVLIGIGALIIGIWFVASMVIPYIPFYFAGPPLHLFSIHNQDLNGHEVMIEIFDSNNKSVFKEKYELGPEEDINYPEDVWEKRKWPKGEYLFEVTLDNRDCRKSPILKNLTLFV